MQELDIIKNKWNEILLFVQDEMNQLDIQYEVWLKPLDPYAIKGRTLYITTGFNNESMIKMLIKKYYEILKTSINIIAKTDLDIKFISEESKEYIDNLSDSASEDTKDNRDRDQSQPDFNELVKRNGLNPKYTFYSFVCGKSNELAQAASLAVAENPGHEFKILYIHGGVGLGKTHLMHAIAIYILKNDPDARIIYTTMENFTNEYITSIKNKTTEEFRDKYRTADVLLVDDIQFIANKEGTQEEFFNTFNTLFNNNKQIVISSDKPPKDINNIEERIRSRFEGGMIVDIQPPNFETRMAILRKKEELEGYNIDDEVLKYIATNIKSNIRTLEGALQRIVFQSKLERTPVNAESAARILINVIKNENHTDKITPEKIISVVAEHYQLNERDLISSKKNKELAYPRQIIMYLCCEMTEETQKRIGMALGGRDHATVIHGRDKITEDIKKDDKLKADIDILKKKLSP